MGIKISKKRHPLEGKSWKFRHLGESQDTYIYPHYHCAKCNAIIEAGEEYSKKLVGEKGYPGYDYLCSPQCAEVSIKEQKSKRRTKYLWIALIIPVVAVLIWLLLS